MSWSKAVHVEEKLLLAPLASLSLFSSWSPARSLQHLQWSVDSASKGLVMVCEIWHGVKLTYATRQVVEEHTGFHRTDRWVPNRFFGGSPFCFCWFFYIRSK